MKSTAPKALYAIQEHRITPEFESVVSMIMHNCGPLWTACSMGLAHALDEVFLFFPQAHRFSHGMRVGFATIPMLAYAHKDDNTINEYVDFCRKIGIPTSLRELRLDGIPADAWREAANSTIGMRNTLDALPYSATFEEVLTCLLQNE